jgi:hypothetical protein
MGELLMSCDHRYRDCLNNNEIIRKYLCRECRGVFICACEVLIALKCLPHQMAVGTEHGTQRRLPVTGIAQAVCSECRGEREEPFPRAAIFGLKGKVERFYWREIIKTYYSRVLDFVGENDIHIENIMDFESSYPEKAKELRKEAKGYWILAHKKTPKYLLKELTNPEFLAGESVPETIIDAEYRQVEKGGQPIGKWGNSDGQLVAVEEIAEDWYAIRECECHSCERSLISLFVGAFLAPVIQDPSDPRVVRSYRHSTRGWSPSN